MWYGLYMSIASSRLRRTQKSAPSVFSTAPGRTLPDTLYGVTTEYVTQLAALGVSLQNHARRTTTRIVFQSGMNASSYTSAVATLRTSGYIMGQLYDSTALQAASIAQCQQRTREFLTQFGDTIDIYEIGNELNGEWVGANQAEIDAKVSAIYSVIANEFTNLSAKTAITLNYWPTSNYYAYPWENTLTYAQNMPASLRANVDYLLLSFYETAGDPIYYPTDQDFADIFSTLAPLFPNAKLGMGEIGAQGASDGFPEPSFAEKQRIANRYYGMHSNVKSLLGAHGSRYVGGYFWWYYFQDCVPQNKPGSLWPTIEQNFNNY